MMVPARWSAPTTSRAGSAGRCRTFAIWSRRRTDADDLASRPAGQTSRLEQRPQQPQRLLDRHLCVAKMNRRAGGLDLDPRSWYRTEQLGGFGVESFKRALVVRIRRAESAVTDEPDARYRNQALQLGAGAAAKDHNLLQKACQTPKCVERLGNRDRSSRIGTDLGHGPVEIGDEQELAWIDRRNRRPAPYLRDLIELGPHHPI